MCNTGDQSGIYGYSPKTKQHFSAEKQEGSSSG